MRLESFIESTNLKPTLTGRDVDALVGESLELGVAGVCLPPFWVKRASRDLKGRDCLLVTVIGFPLGFNMTETKEEEARLAIRDGADELDVVLNVSAFKDGMSWPKIELARLSKLAHAHEKILKVIIECPLLSDEEIRRAAMLCRDAGADFVKTATGTTGQAATVHQVTLIHDVLPESVGIKASGGIRTRDQALQLIEAGATRIGTSSAREILTT